MPWRKVFCWGYFLVVVWWRYGDGMVLGNMIYLYTT